MSARRKVAILLGAVLAAGAVAGGVAYAVGGSDDDSPAEDRTEQAFTQAHQGQAAISQKEAEDAALEAHPGTVIESELEAGGSGLIWEVEVTDGSTIREVTVDAQSGEVLGGETEGSEEGE